MRKIEQEMLKAIREGREWKSGNTEVRQMLDGDTQVYLHHNHIANVDLHGHATPNLATLRRWPTPTTKSRLRALGVNLEQHKGVIYVDGEAI